MIIDRMLPGEYDGIGIVKAVQKSIQTPILLLDGTREESKTKPPVLIAGLMII